MTDFDTCVCCGAPVPEGRMVCIDCERGDGFLEEETDDSNEKLLESLDETTCS